MRPSYIQYVQLVYLRRGCASPDLMAAQVGGALPRRLLSSLNCVANYRVWIEGYARPRGSSEDLFCEDNAGTRTLETSTLVLILEGMLSEQWI